MTKEEMTTCHNCKCEIPVGYSQMSRGGPNGMEVFKKIKHPPELQLCEECLDEHLDNLYGV